MPLVRLPKIPETARTVDLDIEADGRYPLLWDNVLREFETITEFSFYSTPLKSTVPNLTVLSTETTAKATIVILEANQESQLNQKFIITGLIKTSTGLDHAYSFVVSVTRTFLTED